MAWHPGKQGAADLKKHIFVMLGGRVRAFWQYGLGCVPLGYTTYAPNTAERTHRTIKDLLPSSFHHESITNLMVNVCNIVESRCEAHAFDQIQQSFAAPLPCLDQWPKARWASRGEIPDGVHDDFDFDQPPDFDHGDSRRKPPGRSNRIGFNDIVDHVREHGADKTFLKISVRMTLADGSEAITLYAMPKYHLRFAWERPRCMRAMQRLGMAETVEDVRAAAGHPKTGAYDVFYHKYLRENFVTVWGTADGQAVDGHKHFIEACGQSEHARFVMAHMKPGWLHPVAQGPKNSRPQPPRPKAATKMSERTKAMLRPPVLTLPAAGPLPAASEVPHAVASEAPATGAPPEHPPPDSSCPVSAGPQPQNGTCGTCIARTAQGWRCERPAKEGGFCAQHAKAGKSKRARAQLAESLKAAVAQAMAAHRRACEDEQERRDVSEAIRQSWEVNSAAQKRLERSLATLAPRLEEHGLARLDTPAHGNCQFEAVTRTAGLQMSHGELRRVACEHMKKFRDLFSDHHVGDYDAYITKMERPGTWGDQLTLTAIAHYLRRPIYVITDTTDPTYILEATPPSTISEEAWGEPIWLVHYAERHYEATAPAPAPASA